MLDPYATNWTEEIRAAEEVRKDRLQNLEEDVKRYAPFYSEQFGINVVNLYDTEVIPENYAYELISLVLPSVAMANPRMRMSSNRVKESEIMRAKGLQHSTNRWIGQTRLKRLAETLAVDYLFRYSVAHIQRAAPPWLAGSPAAVDNWPFVSRISGRDFVYDPMALTQDDCLWLGHKVRAMRQDLRDNAEEEGWDLEVIESLPPMEYDDKSRDSRPANQFHAPDRDMVEYYELWLREYEDEDLEGYDDKLSNGTLITIAVTGNAVEQRMPYGDSEERHTHRLLRKPRAAQNSKRGPYRWSGTYPVPDHQSPLSMLAATQPQQRDVNRQATAISKSVEQYKKIIAVSTGAKNLAKSLQQGSHNNVYEIPLQDFSKQVAGLEVGGVTDQQLKAFGISRERLDRIGGMSQAMQGNVTGQGTATENLIASNRADARFAYVANKFKDFLADVVWEVAWILDTEDGLEIELDESAARELGVERPGWKGGLGKDDETLDAGPIDMEIDMYSMGFVPTQEQTARTQLMLALVEQITALTPHAMYIDVRQVAEALGDINNMPELSRMLDPESQIMTAGHMLQMEIQAGQQPQGGGNAQPRVSRDDLKGGSPKQPSLSAGGGKMRSPQDAAEGGRETQDPGSAVKMGGQ